MKSCWVRDISSERVNINPYKAIAGASLDHELSQAYNTVLETMVRPYSGEVKAANLLKARIESSFRASVVTGQTRTNPPLYFARLDNDASTSTETTGETYPLAISRLGLVLAYRNVSS